MNIPAIRWWIYKHLPDWLLFRVDCNFILPKFKGKYKGAVLVGITSADPDSELYIRPDKPENPARKWYKLARNFEKYEGEGKIEKCDDNIHESIKAWTDAGYEL